MKKLSTRLLAAIVMSLAGIPAHAFIVDLDGTNATGVRDLTILGTTYDVTFELVLAETAPVACGAGVPCDVFFGSETDAQTAVDAINFAFNSTNPLPQTVGSGQRFSYFVPWDKGPGGNPNVQASQGFIQAGIQWGRIPADLDGGTDIIEYARFSPAAAIPIPAAAWLFGSALGILGWIRRRTSKNSIA